MPLHVSILRSSSGGVHCSLIKLYVKMLITLLYLSVMRQHIVCKCICRILAGKYVDLLLCKGYNINTQCTYNLTLRGVGVIIVAVEKQ